MQLWQNEQDESDGKKILCFEVQGPEIKVALGG